MHTITQQQLERSKRFLQTHGRTLDYLLAQFYFWGGSVEDVREALADFQNQDGGFGHAIEPDFRLNTSSPMATSIGLQYACEIGLTADDPMIQKAIQYLLAHFDPDEQRWHAVPETINDMPHAPWWTFDLTTGRCGTENTWANPNAELLGYLWRYKDLVPADFLHSLTDKAMLELEILPVNLEMHDFLCYQRLSENIPEPYRALVMDKLMKSAGLTVDTDPNQWADYGAKPLQIASFPDSPFAEILQASLAANLDYEIEHMNDDGSWSPNWSWFGNYEADWEIAKVEWQGYITVRNLKSLYDFGRVVQSA
ncbi:hypothetical protein [Alicyclobacillus fodiniaquatilis]|uniref:Uncharacterized protein n=1 Tax=Alicyclobacillus fodiniaquatilis TaxID=1661150 RepID=A0ABW4JPB3_9BACL